MVGRSDVLRHRPFLEARIWRVEHEAGLERNSSRVAVEAGGQVAMSRRDLILGERREEIRSIAARRKATSIALTGSVARGSDVAASDCDFIVETASGATLFDLAGLQCDLEDLLGCNVDVVEAKNVKPGYEQLFADALLL